MAHDIEVQIQGDSSDLGQALDQAERQSRTATQGIQDAFERLGNRLSSLGTTLSLAITAPLAAVGAGVAKLSIDAVESENLFSVAFKGMADTARAWSQEMRKELGLNEYEVRKNSATFYTMFQSMQLGEQASYQMSTGLTKLAYDMASFYNLKPEEAFIKLRAGIMGETEPLKQLGILVDEETTKQQAMKDGIIQAGEELNQQGKVLARFNSILRQTNDAQGDLARTIDSPSNKLKIMKQNIEQTAISMGMTLMPHIERLVKWMESLVNKIDEAVKWFQSLSPTMQNVVLGLAVFMAAIGPLLIAIGNLITACTAIAGAWTAMTAAWAAATAAGTTFGAVLTALSGPIGWAIAAVAALAAAIYLIVTNWDTVKAWMVSFWNNIVSVVSNNIGVIIALFPGLGLAIAVVSKYWQPVFEWFASAWQSIADFIGKCVEVIKKIIDGVAEAWPKFIDGAAKGIAGFASAIGQLTEKIVPQWAKDLYGQVVQLGNALRAETAQIGEDIRRNLTIQAPAGSMADLRRQDDSNTGQPAGTGGYTPVAVPTGLSVTGGSGSGANGKEREQMRDWQAELDAMKAATDAFHDLELSAERDFWQQKLLECEKGSDNYIEIQTKIAELNKEIRRKELSDAVDLLKEDMQNTDKSYQERVAAATTAANKIKMAYGETSKEYRAALREIRDLEKQWQQEKSQLAVIAAEQTKNAAMYELDVQADAIRMKRELGEINAQQEIVQLKKLEQEKFRILQDEMMAKIAAASQDKLLQAQLYKDLEQLKLQHNLKMNQMDNQLRLSIKQSWDQTMGAIKNAFDNAVVGLVSGQMTWRQAVRSILQAALQDWTRHIAQKISQKLFGLNREQIEEKKKQLERQKTEQANENAVNQVRAVARQADLMAVQAHGASVAAASGAAAQASVAVSVAAFQGVLAMLAAMAAAIAAIPGGQPLAQKMTAGITAAEGLMTGAVTTATGAITAAVSAYSATGIAGVAGGAPTVPSGAGGWKVPRDTLMKVHEDEVVLPKYLADGFESMIGGGGDVAMAGSPNFNINISALDAKDVKRLFSQHGGAIVKSLTEQHRNFNKGRR